MRNYLENIQLTIFDENCKVMNEYINRLIIRCKNALSLLLEILNPTNKISLISEDSSILGKSLIFVGLAEGVCLYGLIISFMILGQL